jgi:hypothetical protein
MLSDFGYQKTLKGISYALSSQDGSFVPCSILDHILTFKGSRNNLKIRFFSFLDGTEINQENVHLYIEKIREQISKREYATTDHLLSSVKVANVTFLYVSLNNSVRSSANGFPLYKRLKKLCQVISTCISNLGPNTKCVVFFSESCCPSFEGGDPLNRINEVSWFNIRRVICRLCGLEYLGECSSNDDPNCMSFGVSAFCLPNCMDDIVGIIPRRILAEDFGSGAVGIKLISGEIIWGVHIPHDFVSIGAHNLGAKAMIGLCKVMETHQGSILAIGDFNTIPGEITQSIAAVIPENMELLFWDFPTFYGSFYDQIKPRDGEVWRLI